MKVAAAISLPGRRTPNLWSLIFQIVFWVLTEIYRVVVSDIFLGEFSTKRKKTALFKISSPISFFWQKQFEIFFLYHFFTFPDSSFWRNFEKSTKLWNLSQRKPLLLSVSFVDQTWAQKAPKFHWVIQSSAFPSSAMQRSVMQGNSSNFCILKIFGNKLLDKKIPSWA